MKTIYNFNYKTGHSIIMPRTSEISFTARIIAFLLLAFICFSSTLALAQRNNNGGGNNNNDPCNTSQPRPISGNQHPCPGSLETYCIENRGYTSFVWDVPRAQAGQPPIGWEIVSGQGTSCVTVRVGYKSGTMKVTVTHPRCGTKVATLPVKPSNAFVVDITGKDSVCTDVEQVYTAIVSDSMRNGNGNGNGQTKGEFNYTWTVPVGWTITNGQGTQQITVIPGETDGMVSVSVTFVPRNGNGNNGNGLGGNHGYCNNANADIMAVHHSDDCGPINPLPVELSAFEAARTQAGVLLNWSTASEINNKEFVIERSANGKEFTQVDVVAGHGNSNYEIKYSYTDKTAPATLVYYRLKQVDFDGKSEYSPVKAVKSGTMGMTEPVQVFPNPVSSTVNIQLPATADANTQVNVMSVTGQVVWSGTANDLAAKNQQLDMSNFTSGTYIISVLSGSEKQSMRITKL